MNERRRHPRVRLNAEFEAIVDDNLAFIEDLSLGGAFLRTRARTEIGQEVEIRASLVLDDIYVVHAVARVVGRTVRGQGSVRGLHLEFLRLSPEVRARVERALAFCAVRHRLTKNDPQAISAWEALHEPVDQSPVFDDRVLNQPSLLAPAQALDQRFLRRLLRSRRETVFAAPASADKAQEPATSQASAQPARKAPISFDRAPSLPSRAPGDAVVAQASHEAAARREDARNPAQRQRVPGRAVSTTNPRAKTSKTAASANPRAQTLSVPLSSSEVEAWEAALTPIADAEPPMPPIDAKRTKNAERPSGEGRSEEEVTQVFSLVARSDREEPMIESKVPARNANPSQDTPLPAHLRLPSPDEDFI